MPPAARGRLGRTGGWPRSRTRSLVLLKNERWTLLVARSPAASVAEGATTSACSVRLDGRMAGRARRHHPGHHDPSRGQPCLRRPGRLRSSRALSQLAGNGRGAALPGGYRRPERAPTRRAGDRANLSCLRPTGVDRASCRRRRSWRSSGFGRPLIVTEQLPLMTRVAAWLPGAGLGVAPPLRRASPANCRPPGRGMDQVPGLRLEAAAAPLFPWVMDFGGYRNLAAPPACPTYPGKRDRRSDEVVWRQEAPTRSSRASWILVEQHFNSAVAPYRGGSAAIFAATTRNAR
jgi:hypothetical protein